MQEIADDIGWIMLLTTREQKLLAGRSEKQAESRRVKYWITALAVLASLSTSIALADDFKTINGKEYKNAEVSRVEPDGIVLRSKSGISKVYFTELPKDVQERFHYNPAQATAAPRPAQATAAPRQREREQIALRAEQDAIRRQTEVHSQHEETVAAADFSFFIALLVIAILVTAIIAIVAVVSAKRRREKRASLLKQARDFVATVQQNRALPTVTTDIILKPGESAFYSTPSVLYETRAVRHYQAGHTGFRIAKGVYVGGTSGRSVSTQQWAKLDAGRLTITNKRLVFVGRKEDRTIPLNKVVSVEPNLTEIVISVEGRQKAMALEVANPLIAMTIIRLCPRVTDPLNLSGDNINIDFKE